MHKTMLKQVIINLLKTNKSILLYHKSLAKQENVIKIYDTVIKDTEKAIKNTRDIKHEKVLSVIYNTLIGGKEPYYTFATKVMTDEKTTIYWDNDGYNEFEKMLDSGQLSVFIKNNEADIKA